MTITKEELNQLLGSEQAQSIQCVFTVYEPTNETFEMCSEAEANHISVYLRIPGGEVVPVRDCPIKVGHLDAAKADARAVISQITELLGALTVEANGALPLLSATPTLEEVRAAGEKLIPRAIEEDHGGKCPVTLYDVIYFDGKVCRYSDDVYDLQSQAHAAIHAMGDTLPDHWDVYTPSV